MMRYLLVLIITLSAGIMMWGTEPLEVTTLYHDSVTIDRDIPVGDDCRLLVMEVRAPFARSREPHGVSRDFWGISWRCCGHAESYCCTLARGNTDNYDFANAPFVQLTVKAGDREIVSQRVFDDVGLVAGAENSLCVTIDAHGAVRVAVGNHELVDVAAFSIGDFRGVVSWRVVARENVGVIYAMSREGVSKCRHLMTDWTVASLDQYFASSVDPLEGYWAYLDRENDSKVMKPGGFYTIAVVAAGSGNYDLIYVDGATVNSGLWSTGMRKGRLVDTRFVNHYDLVWVDAVFDTMSRDVSASVEQGAVLILSFPVYRSQMRFVKTQRAR